MDAGLERADLAEIVEVGEEGLNVEQGNLRRCAPGSNVRASGLAPILRDGARSQGGWT